MSATAWRALKRVVPRRSGMRSMAGGAGSGKTRVLTRRIAYLLAARDVHPGAVLAITFTNKAAGEMRERVADLVGPRARSMWVSTFHSACVRILRREIARFGLPTSFSIYDAAGISANEGAHEWQSALELQGGKSVGVYSGLIGSTFAALVANGKISAVPGVTDSDGRLSYALTIRASNYTGDGSSSGAGNRISRGAPATSTMHLGRSSVSGRRRDPLPAASRMAPMPRMPVNFL